MAPPAGVGSLLQEHLLDVLLAEQVEDGHPWQEVLPNHRPELPELDQPRPVEPVPAVGSPGSVEVGGS